MRQGIAASIGKHRVMHFTALAALLGLALLVAACGSSGSSSSGSSASGKPFAGQTLTVLNWQGYGSDLPWAVKQFEEMTGAKIVPVYKASDQGEIQMLQNGGIGKIDVALTNHAYMQPSIELGLLQPLDVSKLENYDKLYPELKDLPSLHSGSETYGVPWEWGLTSLCYNPDKISTPPDSWSALWAPDYARKVAFFDDPQTAVESAAFYLGEDPANPDLAKIHDALSSLKKNVKVLWASSNDWTRAFSTGQVVIGNAWSSLPNQLKTPAIKFIVPKEGAVGWLDSWTIVKNSPHPDLAYAWLNYMTGLDFQSRFSREPANAAGPANQAAAEALPADVVSKLNANPEWLPSIHFIQITAAQLKEWTQLWETVKAGG